MGKRIDLTGQRFGRLVVLDFFDYDHNHKALWKCQCDCGNQKVVRANELRAGKTQSCGCLHKQQLSERVKKHGGRGTRLFNIWKNMKARCYNPKNEKYVIYGERGITVCEEWIHDFEKFRDWALSHGYQEHLTIDRIDVNGDYCPENCRWGTALQQARNKQHNHLITYKNETKTLSEWAEQFHVDHRTISRRLKVGWSIKEALETPVGERSKK